MMGKSPLMKKLVGNQHKLPNNLKAAIKAAPSKMKDLSGDGKVTKKDVLIGRGVIKPDGTKVKSPTKLSNKGREYYQVDTDGFYKKVGDAISSAASSLGSYMMDRARATSPSGKTKKEKKDEIKNKNQVLSGLPESKFGKIGSDIMKKNQPKFNDTSGSIPNISENKPKESSIKKDTKKILDKNKNGKSSVSLGDSRNISGRSTNPSRLSSMIGKDNAVQAGINAMKATAVTQSKVPKTEVKNGKDKAKADSGSGKRLPIDAMQDRLTKNIDRRTRKSDVRKQTRTAKKSLRQEGFKRSAARDKVGKLGINPNTGKSFTSAKQKQDFINNRSNKKKSNTNQTSNPFSKEQQAEIDRTAAAFGFGGKVNTSSAGTSKQKEDKKKENNNNFFAGGGSPGKLMKTKNKSKMMKKSPNKMMKKKSPNMMMKKKKSPTMMMKKKSSMKMMKKKK